MHDLEGHATHGCGGHGMGGGQCGEHARNGHCEGHGEGHECHHGEGHGAGPGLCRMPPADSREALLAQKARLEEKLAEVEKRLQAL
ncbi:MAG TPA: hypothetical protein PLP25_09415 [Candidatus Limiplasma sp.]|nr:hypothetical protein [Candidatus Limiplasma sp.]HPS82061.1 hypothetical protein [Candidatus Limiplasma sp.]